MGNVINLKPSVDVHFLYTCSDIQLLEIIFPFNHNIESRKVWRLEVAKSLSRGRQKVSYETIKNLERNSKLPSISRIHIEDLARKKITEQPQDNINQFSFRLRGRG